MVKTFKVSMTLHWQRRCPSGKTKVTLRTSVRVFQTAWPSARSLSLGIQEKWTRDGLQICLIHADVLQLAVYVPFSCSVTIQVFSKKIHMSKHHVRIHAGCSITTQASSSLLASTRAPGSPGLSNKASWRERAELLSRHTLQERQRRNGRCRAETHSSRSVNQLSQNLWWRHQRGLGSPTGGSSDSRFSWGTNEELLTLKHFAHLQHLEMIQTKPANVEGKQIIPILSWFYRSNCCTWQQRCRTFTRRAEKWKEAYQSSTRWRWVRGSSKWNSPSARSCRRTAARRPGRRRCAARRFHLGG